jgi:hypothetical protein
VDSVGAAWISNRTRENFWDAAGLTTNGDVENSQRAGSSQQVGRSMIELASFDLRPRALPEVRGAAASAGDWRRAAESTHAGLWASTISFFLALFGWVALAPRSLDVERSMVVCENQLFPQQEFPKRTAYLKFKSLGTLLTRRTWTHQRTSKDVPAVISCTGTGSAEAVCLKYRP